MIDWISFNGKELPEKNGSYLLKVNSNEFYDPDFDFVHDYVVVQYNSEYKLYEMYDDYGTSFNKDGKLRWKEEYFATHWYDLSKEF